MKIFCIISCLFFASGLYAETTFGGEHSAELMRLEEAAAAARREIRSSSEVRAKDFLKLLPGVAVSRTTPYQSTGDGETYLSFSFSANQIWDITDAHDAREHFKTRALREIDSIAAKGKILIERKHLLKSREWKLKKIRTSLENPVDIADIDEKADETAIRIQELEIALEQCFKEMDFLVNDAGR